MSTRITGSRSSRTRPYPTIMADTVRRLGVAGLWQFECAVRSERGTLDQDRLSNALALMLEGGRLVGERTESGRTVYRFGEGHR